MQPSKFEEFGLDELKVPAFIAQKRRRPSGEIRCAISLGRCVYIKETRKRRIVDQKVVGVVENCQEFGRIIFKDEFLDQYPQLRDVTVLRKESGKYVYIKAKLDEEAYDTAYLKNGPKRYNPKAEAAPDDDVLKDAGPVFLLNEVSEAEKILPSVKAAFPKHIAHKLIDCAHFGVIDRGLDYYVVQDICDNRLSLTQGMGMSLSSLCRSIRSLKPIWRMRFWKEFNKARLIETDPILGHPCLIADGTSISTYSEKLPEAKWGNNKDHEDLRQVNLMVITDTKGMPRSHYFHAGNINDSAAFKGDAQDVENVLWANGIEDLGAQAKNHVSFVWLFDRGFTFSSILCPIREAGNHFLGCISASSKIAQDALDYAIKHNIRFNGESFAGHSGLRHMAVPKELCSTITTQDGKKHPVYAHVYYDDKAYAKSVLELNDKADTIMIARRQGTYSSLSESLRKKDKKLNLVQKVEHEDGQVTYKVNGDAIHKQAYEEAMWVLITSLELGGLEVHEAYHKRNNIEVTIRNFKDLNFDRLYAQDSQALEGRGFVAMLTTMEHIALLNRCYEALDGKYGVVLTPQMIKYLRKPRRLLELLKSIKATVTAAGEIIVQRVGSLERSLFLAMGLNPPGGQTKYSKEEGEVYAYSPNAPEGYTIDGAIEDGLTSIRNRQIIHA